uniref:Uncharacterized protein n=1 Tax=Arundo donax TaxID=35708 RepID=A0A0A9KNY9_ARUDO
MRSLFISALPAQIGSPSACALLSILTAVSTSASGSSAPLGSTFPCSEGEASTAESSVLKSGSDSGGHLVPSVGST